MKSRKELEKEVKDKYKGMAEYWRISASEAEKRATQLIPYNSDKELRDVLKTPKKAMSVNMLDPAHRESDIEIGKMEREVRSTYSQAAKEMQEKLDKYLQNFEKDVEKKKAELDSGKITEKEYKEWYRTKLANKMLRTKTWEGLRDNLAKDASNANDIAHSIIYGHMPNVYAANFNFGTYQIEKGTNIDTSFTLYDRDTVENLMREDQKLLPPPPNTDKWRNTSINVAKGVTAKKKDIAWNNRAIQNQLTQGILQGESIPHLSKRLQTVQLMNNRAAIRYARTMTTAAENAGRIDAFKRAQDGGIDVQPAWMATLDGRTRDSHRALDGETRDPKTGKFSNGCRYPGDPQGRPEEVYNCRCTLVAQLKGFEKDFSDPSWRHHEGLGGMSYEDWKAGHKKQVEKQAQILGTGSGVSSFFQNDGSYKKWKTRLTSAQKDAISHYTSGDYININNYLRGTGNWDATGVYGSVIKEAEEFMETAPEVKPEEGESHIHFLHRKDKIIPRNYSKAVTAKEKAIQYQHDIDDAISKTELKEPIVTYRSIERDGLPKFNDVTELIGKEYSDSAFMSTSPASDSSHLNADYIMQIEVPAGKGKGAYLEELTSFHGEYELLLPRNSKFIITGTEEKDDKIIIKMKMQ